MIRVSISNSNENKLIEFTRKGFIVNKEVEKSYWNKEKFVRMCDYKCPCGKSNFQMEESPCNEKGELVNPDYNLTTFAYRLMRHIERKIRLNADKFHIDLLFEIFGEEFALILLNEWAERNMLIALMLKKYIKLKMECKK